MEDINQTGKFLAYILRHNPSAVEIELDEHGFANVQQLLDGVNRTGRRLDMQTLEEIVAKDSKGRYSFNSDKSKIRANQGHSVQVDLQLEEKNPPDTLYHGTAERFLESIKQSGIQKRSRNFVHLSKDEQTATAVGIRHGKPVILVINAKQMAQDGFKFYISENGVWLTDSVPFKYVTQIISQ